MGYEGLTEIEDVCLDLREILTEQMLAESLSRRGRRTGTRAGTENRLSGLWGGAELYSQEN